MSSIKIEDSNDENSLEKLMSKTKKRTINRTIFNKPKKIKNIKDTNSEETDIISPITSDNESDISRNKSYEELKQNVSSIKLQELKCIFVISYLTLLNKKKKNVQNFEEINDSSVDLMDISDNYEEKINSISLGNNNKNDIITFDDKKDNNKNIFNKKFLPCREEEQNEIYNYIKNGLITYGNYNPLYICGMPGTGKTKSVKRVIKIIKEENKENNDVPFRYLFLNAVNFNTNIKVIKGIYDFIFSKQDQEIKALKYLNILDTFFSNRNNFKNTLNLNDPTNSHIILIIDEIDYLINKFKLLLYHIFNWTTYKNSKLIIISISNLIMIDKYFSLKIISRFGQNKILFKPYNKEQIREIIQYKDININLFDEDALKLASMKVAAINGDLRRVISILRHAIEIYKSDIKINNKENLINKFYIIKSCQDLFNGKIINTIKNLKIFEKIIISSILFNIIKNNENFVKMENIYDALDVLLKKYNEFNIHNDKLELDINWDEFKNIVFNLKRLGLIEFRDNDINNFNDTFVVIKFYADEFSIACDSDEELKQINNFLN